jgi:hypothetical protein
MTNDFRAVVLAHLGDPLPRARTDREAVYTRIRAEFDAMLDGETEAGGHATHAAALQQAIDTIEAELAAAGQSAPAAEPTEKPPAAARPVAQPIHKGKVAAAAVAAIAMLAAGAWYVVAPPRELPTVPSVVPQKEISADPRTNLDPAATDKGRSFTDALRNGDAGTVAFLMQSGYRPTRVELRTALLQVKYTPQIQAATLGLAPDIRDITCGFTTFYDVRKPMTPARLFDAEDAFAIMKQLGQDVWKSTCTTDRAKWRDALARIEKQYAQYSKPDAEKKAQSEACVRRFNTKEAMERWEQANCEACPENHSNCETYCPQAPKATDADEARFFSFNRGDMSMATTTSHRPNSSRADVYCNLQYLTRTTDFDLANLQRFRTLVSLFD